MPRCESSPVLAEIVAPFARNLTRVRYCVDMANSFSRDILIQSPDPSEAARFYVEQLGFTVTATEPMIALEGGKINLYIEQGAPLGPVLEVNVPDVAATRARLVAQGCEVVKDEPDFPRCYVRDPYGLVYNLNRKSSE